MDNLMRKNGWTKKPIRGQYLNYVYKNKSGKPEKVRLGCYYWVNDGGWGASSNNYKEWTVTVNFAAGIPAGLLMEYYFREVVQLCTRDPSITVCFILKF